jgi:hypothetical protein
MNDFTERGPAPEETGTSAVLEADVVIGLYAGDSADDIALAVDRVSGGAAAFRPGLKTVIVCADASQAGGTREAFRAAPCKAPKIYLAAPPQGRAKKESFFSIVAEAHRLKARAVAIFESGTATLKKAWCPRLLDPILDSGACYTSPIYARHLFDLPITYLLSYPLFRALFGRRVRNIHLGDCAFSGTLNAVFHDPKAWPEEPAFCSAEITMAALAVNHGPVFQSFMGDPRVGRERLPVDLSLGEEFVKCLRSFYQLMDLRPDLWRKTRNSRPTPVTGGDLKAEYLPPRELVGTVGAYQSLISSAAKETREIWETEFQGHLALWNILKTPPGGGLEVHPADWADLVYRGAAAFRCLEGKRDLVVKALMPVFLARLLHFKKTTSQAPDSQTFASVEAEAEVFEKAKPKLLALWGD